MEAANRNGRRQGARWALAKIVSATVLCAPAWMPATALAAAGQTASAQVVELRSPWDLRPVKLRDAKYSCPNVPTLPHDVEASDYYSDTNHSIKDPKRYAAYNQAADRYRIVSEEAARAADQFQSTGDAGAAACVVKIIKQQAQADAMTGSMSSNQANYVQNWTLGALAISYLKARQAGPEAMAVTPAETAALQAWMKLVGQQVETYFSSRRAKGTTDGRNNHFYWAGFAAMAAGIATNDHGLYDWGVTTYQDGVNQIAPDGTLPLEMARGQRALHYHLFALAPLVTMAELGAANGEDLYSYDHNRLHLLVSRSLAGLVDNHYFSTRAGALQDTPEGGKIKSADVIWVTPYVRRFPDPTINAILSHTAREPYGYLGGLPPQ